jgi:hypothetical protein
MDRLLLLMGRSARIGSEETRGEARSLVGRSARIDSEERERDDGDCRIGFSGELRR